MFTCQIAEQNDGQMFSLLSEWLIIYLFFGQIFIDLF